MNASIGGAAVIIRAGIPIIAIEGQADANAGLAMVVVGAGIPVETCHPVQGLVDAAVHCLTEILGALVPVFAQVAVVRISVTVIVRPIAALLRRRDSRAFPQPLFRAYPPPLASPELICRLAAGLGLLRNGVGRAGTLPLHEHALAAGLTFGRLGLLALVPGRARCALVAACTAQGANFGPVDYTLATAQVFAVVALRTRQAEGRVQRLADRYRVRPRSGFAGPPLRAFFHAGLGADLVAKMKDAPPREAVRVGVTRAPGAGVGRRARLRVNPDVELGHVAPQVEEIGKTTIDPDVVRLDLPHLGLTGTVCGPRRAR